jgi:SAM-dependent methyltransferase
VNAYDETPWSGDPCASSHPDKVGAIARLFGLAPAAATRCRVLELGCASGANLIPMAAALPGSQFVGVDLSPVQISKGRREVEALGLANLTLQTGDIATLEALGTFDFVLAHGVFSWVARPVQEGLLSTIRSCLSPQGAAFVSYSALPGAYPRQALREMLLWHVRGDVDPGTRVERARRFAEFIAANASKRAPHAAALRRLVGEMGGLSDSTVLHDYLAAVHEPLTLSAFVARAAEHRLQYLGDAQFHSMFAEDLEPEVSDTLRRDALDQVAFEQTLDFLAHRPFRTSLLCRAEQGLDRTLSWERLEGLHLSSRARATEPRDGLHMFVTRDGEPFGTESALVGAALQLLVSAWPRPIEFSALCRSAGAQGSSDREVVGRNLLAAFAANQVELGTSDRGISGVVALPQAPASARAQAARGGTSATNLLHEGVVLEPWQRALLPLLDGRRSHADLLTAMTATASTATAAALAAQLAELAAAAFLVRAA